MVIFISDDYLPRNWHICYLMSTHQRDLRALEKEATSVCLLNPVLFVLSMKENCHHAFWQRSRV